MTGEITLSGQVLPIGGLKEKALAAQRNRIRRVIAPALNEQDADDIPAHLRKDLEFVFVSTIDRGTRAAARASASHGQSRILLTRPTHRGSSMSFLNKKAKAVPFSAADVANINKVSPYVQRLIEDARLRDNLRAALDSSRSAYGRVTNGKTPAKALLEDKKLHKDIQEAVEAVRDATTALTEAPKKRARKGLRLGPQAAVRERGSPGWRSRGVRSCARRCSTPCSAPRRSSSTHRRRPRRPRRRLLR